jgi:hypothetical protein
MASDIIAHFAGVAIGIGLVYAFIKYLKTIHIYFVVIFLAGAAVAALGALFLAWPLTPHIGIMMLIGVLLWTGFCVRLFVQNTSSLSARHQK